MTSPDLPGVLANVSAVVQVTTLTEDDAKALALILHGNGPEQVLEALWWLGALMSHLETVDDGRGPKKVRYYAVQPPESDEKAAPS